MTVAWQAQLAVGDGNRRKQERGEKLSIGIEEWVEGGQRVSSWTANLNLLSSPKLPMLLSCPTGLMSHSARVNSLT